MSVRVGLARAAGGYAGITPPFRPGPTPPELRGLLGTDPAPANPVHAAVRSALHALGLDAARFGSPAWNPLGELAAPGSTIVLKPNLIRHWNPAPDGSLDSLVTHGSVLRAIADYALLAAGSSGRVIVAEAPQHDCRLDLLRAALGLDAIRDDYRARCGRDLEILDLRREEVDYEDGVIVARRKLPGDPLGYRLIDLADRSAFADSGLDPQRFRGADYDPEPTTRHHTGGHHEYLLSETVLRADLVVNLPKLKTHKKTGVTLALKNLVGINGDKNLLPHHCVGSESEGGDEFPGEAWLDRGRSRASELARWLLKHGFGTGLLRIARKTELQLRGDRFVRAGNWHRNRTTWRMCQDLNRCLYYSDSRGAHFDAPQPVRRVLTLLDAIVAGEGEGPLAPSDRRLGVVLASLDPIALDLAAVRLMGFDETRIPKIWEAMRSDVLRVTCVRRSEDVEIFEGGADDAPLLAHSLDELTTTECFRAHTGWAGHLEKRACAA